MCILCKTRAQNSIKVRKTAIKTTMQTNTLRSKVSRGFYLFNLCTHRLSYEILFVKRKKNERLWWYIKWDSFGMLHLILCLIQVSSRTALYFQSLFFYFLLLLIIFHYFWNWSLFHLVNKNRSVLRLQYQCEQNHKTPSMCILCQ